MKLKYTDFMRPEDISVAAIWRVLVVTLFKDKVVSRTQHDEMRRTFYMGFTECFKIMNDLAEVLSEDQAASILSKINNELNVFHDAEMKRILGQ